MPIVDEMRAMLAAHKGFEASIQEALELRSQLLSQGLIQPKKYDLPLPDIMSTPPHAPQALPDVRSDHHSDPRFAFEPFLATGQ